MRVIRSILSLGAIIMLAGAAGCTSGSGAGGRKGTMAYAVQPIGQRFEIDGDWDKAAWRDIKPLELTHFMGKRPEHFPKTQARFAYDPRAVYVIFRVEDRYVRAVAKAHQDPVCLDSCVEFFFTPGRDPAAGYFNLEMNCGGTMLLAHQLLPRADSVSVNDEDLERIQVAHSMDRIVDPEIVEPTTWTVEYRLPIELLAKYRPGLERPAPGVTWRANVYKCADKSSKPHWLTWAPVRHPTPDFHRPEFFGTFEFK